MKKKIISRLASIALCAAAILSFTNPCACEAQGVPPSGVFAVNTLSLPFTTLAAGTTTNLAAGWQSVVSVTNISTTWNSSSNAFVTVTNIINSTNTTFADMSIINQKDLGLIVSQSASGAGTNVLTFGRLLDSKTVDTNLTTTLTVGQTAAGFMTGSTNFPSSWSGGFGGVRLLTVAWTAASGILTNGNTGDGSLVKYAIKRNAW